MRPLGSASDRRRASCMRWAVLLAALAAALGASGCKQPTAEEQARALALRLVGTPAEGGEEALGEPDWGSHGAVAGLFCYDVARSWRDDGAKVKLLILALEDADPRARAIAARALGVIGDTRAINPLTRAFWRSVREEDALRSETDETPELRYRRHFERVSRHQCVWALGLLIYVEETVLPVLVGAARDADQTVALDGVGVLYILRSPGAIAALRDIANWQDPPEGGDAVVRGKARSLMKALGN